MSKKQNGKSERAGPVGTTVLGPEDADRFDEAAAAWSRKATRNKTQALKTLVEIGILTPSGRLTKHYR